MAKKLKLGSGLENLINQKIKNSYSAGSTDSYSCNYVNNQISPLSMIDDICHERQVYRGSTGSRGWFELFRLPSTGGWNGITIDFELIGYSVGTYHRAFGSYYHNSDYNFRYINKFGNASLYYNKNSDNTMSIYLYVADIYAPKTLKVLSYYNHRSGYTANIFDDGFPKEIDEPSSKTEFSTM